MARTLALLAVIWAAGGAAWAGPVTIRIPNGAKVQVNVTYKDSSTASLKTTDDAPIDENKNPGTFTITVPDENNAKKIEVISLGVFASLPTINEHDFGVAGLFSFEPVDLPAFSALDSNTFLLAEIDVPTFVAGTNPFTEGQDFTATGGHFSGADGIVFRDATSLYGSFFDVFFDISPAAIDSLPLYTGRITVQPDIQYRVPEPGSLSLVGSCLAGLMLWRRARRAQTHRVGGSKG